MIIEPQNLQQFIEKFVAELKRMQYAVTNIIQLSAKCHELETYALSQGIEKYDVELGTKFLSDFYPLTGKAMNWADIDFHTRTAYWAIGLLNDFWLHGIFTTLKMRKRVGLSEEHEKILFDFHKWQLERDYADGSAVRYRWYIQIFLQYLEGKKVSVSDISEADIIGFLSAYIDKSKSYLQAILCGLKRYAAFARDTGLTKSDFAKFIPPISKVSHPRVPSVWEDGDVDKLLASVDRSSPCGKRDYAILMLAAKLGLRCSDIDWVAKRISIMQCKTRKQLTLPIPNDVGWAVIEYLKHGRPESDYPNVFLRHVAPIAPFFGTRALNSIISQYRVIAGVDCGDRARRGMHSLRHTFATRLLREKVPLEIIAEMLGHVGLSSVDIYLSVETEELRACALNPDEVFAHG
jgi:integrase